MNLELLTQEQKNNIQDFYTEIEDIVTSVYLTGSLVVGVIDITHDIDIILMFDNKEKRREYIKKLMENTRLKELLSDAKELNISYMSDIVDGDKIFNRPYMYLRHYMKLLYGEDLHLNFDIESNRELLIGQIKKSIDNVDLDTKYLYYILTAIYILQNNSFEFNEEQIENINICHDKSDKAKMGELLRECINWLNNQTLVGNLS